MLKLATNHTVDDLSSEVILAELVGLVAGFGFHGFHDCSDGYNEAGEKNGSQDLWIKLGHGALRRGGWIRGYG